MNNSVRITNLKLRNYRNHRELSIIPKKDIIVIYGKNGSGKTNILESISLLNSNGGFRNANLSDLIHENHLGPLELFGANFQIKLDSDIYSVGLGLKKKGEDLIKIINIDSMRTNTSNLNNKISFFWVVPRMSHLLQNTPMERRAFIDMMIGSVDKSYSERLQEYRKLKKERLKILKNKNFKNHEKWLDIIEQRICSSGLIICDSRRTFLKSLNKRLKVINDKTESLILELNGTLDKILLEKPALFVEEFFIQKLKENRFKDSISGRTNFSANKTDLVIYDLKKRKEVKNFSTGEQKLIIISIILSFIEFIKTSKSEKLIFLLDDIFSYLDSNYISRLLQELSKLNIQTWITDVRADWISNSPMLKNIIHKINIGDKHFKVPNIKI
jgi:DNA replication and repair protein RecF